MSENVRKFAWSKAKQDAAQLLAEDELTDAEIAAAIGGTDRQLRRWKDHPDFAARVETIRQELGQVSLRRAIARRARRVRALDERWAGLQQIVEERGASEHMQSVPGGKTGLLVRQVKGIGTGDNFQLVYEYVLDAPLLRELREHEKQAAQELGQWAQKHEHSGPGGGPIEIVAIEAVRPPSPADHAA